MRSNYIKVIAGLGIFILAGLSIALHYYVISQHGRFIKSNHATLDAKTVPVIANLGGKVGIIYVQNHSLVKRGDALFSLDARPYQEAVERAQLQLDQINQTIQAKQTAIIEAEKNVAKSQTAVSEASKQAFQNQSSDKDNLDVAQEELDEALQNLQQTMLDYGPRGQRTEEYKKALLKLEQAQQSLQSIVITAPADGYINGFNLAVGYPVKPKQTLFNLIDPNQLWVTANFSENTVKRIQINQIATIKINATTTLTGMVESIHGNEVKIRILTPVTQLQFPLHVKVAIDTQAPVIS